MKNLSIESCPPFSVLEIGRRRLAHDHHVVDAVQLEAVGGEVDVAGVGEDELLSREVGRLRRRLAKRAAWW